MAVRFTLYNNKIEFTDKQEEYNTLRLEYEDKATVAADKYLEFYYSCGSLDSFVEKGAKAGYEIVNEVINDFLTDIVNQGVYSITLKTIEDQYGNYYLKDFVSAFEEVQNQYMEIVLKGEALDAYRTARRENRARWSGGGFGLQGAIKGAASASTRSRTASLRVWSASESEFAST